MVIARRINQKEHSDERMSLFLKSNLKSENKENDKKRKFCDTKLIFEQYTDDRKT